MSLFFVVSKVFWGLLAPSRVVLWLVVVTAGLLLAGRERGGRWCGVAAAASLLIVGVLPLGKWLARPLENRYPRPPWPAHVDGVLTLGGGLGTRTLLSRGAPAAVLSETRLVSANEIARRYPDARIVFAGGFGRFSDARAAQYIFAQMGLAGPRLIFESRSHDTLENLLFARRLVHPRQGEVWLLATSAIHMPRAMQTAQRVGWPMLPWPTDYLTAAQAPRQLGSLDVSANMALTDAAAHEWLGLLTYRFRPAHPDRADLDFSH